MQLNLKIAKLRKENHLSQEDLAQKIGVSRQSVSKWENGASVPELDKLIIMSDIFQITIDELVNEQPFTQPSSPDIISSDKGVYLKQHIIGYFLIGFGFISMLISLILGILFFILSLLFVISGIISLLSKKHTAIKIGWFIFIVISLIFTPAFTSVNMSMIFNFTLYSQGLDIQFFIVAIIWVAYLLLSFFTIKKASTKTFKIINLSWCISAYLLNNIIFAIQIVIYTSISNLPIPVLISAVGSALFILLTTIFTVKKRAQL